MGGSGGGGGGWSLKAATSDQPSGEPQHDDLDLVLHCDGEVIERETERDRDNLQDDKERCDEVAFRGSWSGRQRPQTPLCQPIKS